MVEQKFSLELTKNGIQQTIYAKEGESQARKLKITLTVKGEIVSLAGYSIKAFFDDETWLDVSNEGNPVTFEIPSGLCGEPGERIIELEFRHGGEIVYSPQFRVIVEETIGATASGGAVGNPTLFEPLLATAGDYTGTFDGDEKIPVYDPDAGATRLTTVAKITEEVTEDIADLDERVTEAEGDISDIEDSLALKANTADVNSALTGKVDKVTGKGLSANDYSDTEKANVASNTSARHTHSNKTVLDKFGERGGKPTFDGDEIGGGGSAGALTNSEIISVCSTFADFIEDEGNDILGADSTTAIAF